MIKNSVKMSVGKKDYLYFDEFFPQFSITVNYLCHQRAEVRQPPQLLFQETSQRGQHFTPG